MTFAPNEYAECATCRAKPGSPVLCAACLHNRKLVHDLKQARDDARLVARWLLRGWAVGLTSSAVFAHPTKGDLRTPVQLDEDGVPVLEQSLRAKLLRALEECDVKRAVRWENGNVLVFSWTGEQITELQGPYTPELEAAIRARSDARTLFEGFDGAPMRWPGAS